MRPTSASFLAVQIVRFSELSQSVQVAMVQHLLAGLDAEGGATAGSEAKLALTSTGDGFIVTVPPDAPGGSPVRACALARYLVQHAARFSDMMEVRAGVHAGEAPSDLAPSGDPGFAVGSGLHWSTAMADLAARSQVIASEALVEAYMAAAGGDGGEPPFYPPVNEPPFRMTVRHGRVARFRVLTGPWLSEAPPPMLARWELIGQHLRNALEIVGEALVAGLSEPEEPMEAATARLRPRLTLWVRFDDELRIIRPQVLMPEPRGYPGQDARLGRIAWATRADTSGPRGPVERAYLTRAPVTLVDLPSLIESRSSYYAAWAQEGLPPDLVDPFSRGARAFIAIPLVIFEVPAGVLCIDLMYPLTGMKKVAEAIADHILIQSGYFIASLLEQRGVTPSLGGDPADTHPVWRASPTTTSTPEAFLGEAQVIVLGDPGVGKTSLVRRLLDRDAELPAPGDTTHGVEVSEMTFEYRAPDTPQPATFTARLLDFGGQAIYHATHRLFLTRRSVYILVVNPRLQETDLDYWLSTISLLGGDSPVLIVANQVGPLDIDTVGFALPRRFTAVRGVWKVNIASRGGGLDQLQLIIEAELRALPQSLHPIDPRWRAVKNYVASLPDVELPFTTFRAHCARQGVSDPAACDNLAIYLHDTGVALYLREDDVLREHLILRPQWVMDAACRLLEDPGIGRAAGRFTRAELPRIWPEASDDGERVVLLRVLVSCGICHPLPDRAGYVVPSLLPPAPPSGTPPTSAEVAASWTYEYMPPGLVAWLAAALFEHLDTTAGPSWRGGFALRWQSSTALVREHRRARRIDVSANGPDRRTLLAFVHDALSRAHAAYPGLRAEQELMCPCPGCLQRGQAFRLHTVTMAAARRKPLQCHGSLEDVDPHALLDAVFDRGTRDAPATGDIFVSYAWKADTTPVDEVAELLAAEGLHLRRDTNELDYRAPIRAFMRRLGRGAAVVVVLSDAYLRSLSCMFELAEIATNGDLRGRVYPLLLPGLPIRDAKFRVEVVKHWEQEIQALDAVMKEVEQSNLQGIQEDMNDLRRIRTLAADLMNVLGDMVCTSDPVKLVEALKVRPR